MNVYRSCIQCAFQSFPEIGRIGEILLGPHGSMVASPLLSRCQTDTIFGPACSIEISSLEKHLDRCKVILLPPGANPCAVNNNNTPSLLKGLHRPTAICNNSHNIHNK
jgi:hypothetical protein